jgi:hypothetical protein
MNTKENRKQDKYKNPETEVGRLRKTRTKIVPVITRALGTIKKGLDQTFSCTWATKWP